MLLCTVSVILLCKQRNRVTERRGWVEGGQRVGGKKNVKKILCRQRIVALALCALLHNLRHSRNISRLLGERHTSDEGVAHAAALCASQQSSRPHGRHRWVGGGGERGGGRVGGGVSLTWHSRPATAALDKGRGWEGGYGKKLCREREEAEEGMACVSQAHGGGRKLQRGGGGHGRRRGRGRDSYLFATEAAFAVGCCTQLSSFARAESHFRSRRLPLLPPAL